MKKFLKWFAIVLGIVVLLVAITVIGLEKDMKKRMHKVYDIEPMMIKIPTDSASIETGRQWTAALCQHCHGNDMAGTIFFNDASLGRIDAPNLTPGKGGIGGAYTETDWIRAIRHGLKPDGTPILVMPTADLNHLDDADLGALIAYLKTLPPVNKEWEGVELTTKARVLAALGAFGDVFGAEHINHNAAVPKAPEVSESVQYGNYLVDVFGCNICHGPALNGGKDPNPDAPFAPNLTPGGNLQYWNDRDFIKCMRTGRTPDGRQLSEFMPWRGTANMSDTQLNAILAYLKSLPEMETAKR